MTHASPGRTASFLCRAPRHVSLIRFRRSVPLPVRTSAAARLPPEWSFRDCSNVAPKWWWSGQVHYGAPRGKKRARINPMNFAEASVRAFDPIDQVAIAKFDVTR